MVAAAILGAGALGAGASVFGSLQASKQQQQGYSQGIGTEQGMFDTAMQYMTPFANAGTSVLDTLKKLITPGADQTATLAQTPGFQFASDWGQRGVTAQATTRGLGGNALTAGADYATGLAKNTWSTLVDKLQSFATMGSGAASSIGGTAQGFGSAISNLMVGKGNAAAAGTMGAANAIGGMTPEMIMAALLKGGGGGGQYGDKGALGTVGA